MNLKLLLPTYRNRFCFIKKSLNKYGSKHKFDAVLNLGSGEGDYDAMIADFGEKIVSCDINEADVAFAKQLNAGIDNLNYQIENALELSFSDNTFDLITSMEVIEHVGEPRKMMEEVARIIKDGGYLFITFPSLNFPFSYDPINRILSYFGDKKIAQGAYAFGHDYLIDPSIFEQWITDLGFEIIEERNMGGYLIGSLEVYWTGWIQKLLKANSANINTGNTQGMTIRPSTKEPWLVKITDILLSIDHLLFGKMKNSIGKAFVLKKKV